jgi:biopolymer transport protein ExbB
MTCSLWMPVLAPVPLDPVAILLQCGFAGPVLLLSGLVAVWLAVARWRALRPALLLPESLQRGLEQALRAGHVDTAINLATASPSALGRLVAAGLLLRAGGLDEMLATCERAALRESLLRQAGAAGLARFGTVILMFAVFGTVLGVMSALSVLGAMQSPTVQDAVTGLRESLGCTAIGLFFALVCFVAWALLSSRAAAGLHRVRDAAEDLLAEAARPVRS